MKEMKKNQPEQLKSAKNLKKVQNLKVAVATALGLTAGTGTVIAAEHILNPTEEPAEQPVVEQEEVAAVAEPKQEEPKAATPQTPDHEVNHGDNHNGGGDQPIDPSGNIQPTTLPNFAVVERDMFVNEDGQVNEVAIGFTEGGHTCVVIDTDLDGVANIFWEDTNDNNDFDVDDFILLADNGISIKMDDLIDFSETPDDPTLNLVADNDVIDGAIPVDGDEDVDVTEVEEGTVGFADDDTMGIAELADDAVEAIQPELAPGFVAEDAVAMVEETEPATVEIAENVVEDAIDDVTPTIEELDIAGDNTLAADDFSADNDFLANI